jgi:hypothetical protein
VSPEYGQFPLASWSAIILSHITCWASRSVTFRLSSPSVLPVLAALAALAGPAG